MKFSIWHNIMWARYKAGVFSALHRHAASSDTAVTIYQIAETENNRVGLSPVDKGKHQYPYKLLFGGAYSNIPRLQLFLKIARLTLIDRADVSVLSGYEKPEVWLQALILTLKRQKFAFFCDSTIHDQPQSFLKGLAKRIFFNWANGAFCYGKRSTEYLMHYGVSHSRIHIRCQAAALHSNYSHEAAVQMRSTSRSAAAAPRYLFVGRLSTEKSIDDLLQAFAQIVAREPAATLVLVGQGPARDALHDQCDSLGIADRVIFAGSKFDEDLFTEYSKASCLVLPSKSEPWGLVVNEALSYGCPVVVSDRCGCVPELVIDGETGFVFQWGNVRDLANKLQRVPETFDDVVGTAHTCLRQIAPFNPDTAAAQILEGCRAITGHPLDPRK